MRKLLGHPFTVVFAGAFGALITWLASQTIQRGWFEYISEHGLTRVFSPSSEPRVYWSVSIGMLSLGVSFLAVAAYSAFRSLRALRTGESDWGAPPVSMRGLSIAGAVLGVVVCLISTCARH